METKYPFAKKSLGQHWLNDAAALEAMCEAAEVGQADTVLEIGPGYGSLTAKLAERAKQVIAVEFDVKLAQLLAQKVPAPNLKVVEADILQFNFGSLPAGYKIVANIPYYLTSNLLRVLCEAGNPFSQAALLMQKEVAQRVVAKPGAMSLLSVSVQFYCEVSLGRIVPAELFEPPPKVDSQILKLQFRAVPLFPEVELAKFFRIVKAGFSQRRKTLTNSLSGGLHLSREETEKLLIKSALSPALRAQNLSLEDWHRLYLAYSK